MTAAAVVFATVRLASAGVELRLEPEFPYVGRGARVRVALKAYANGGINESVSGLDAIINWDSEALRLIGLANNPAIVWLLAGLLPDSAADGLNDSFDDGDALFQGIGSFQSPIVVSESGLLIATLTFEALSAVELTSFDLVESFGDFSRSQVLRFGGEAEDILEGLSPGWLTVLERGGLRVPDVWLPAGRVTGLRVEGELFGAASNGVSAVVRIAPGSGSVGTVMFTAAADTSAVEDPWPESGTFSAFQSGVGAGAVNGFVNAAGEDVAGALEFDGALAMFPIVSSPGATGSWDVEFAAHQVRSGWESVATTLTNGVVHLVEPGDGSGDGVLDAGDAGELAACLNGPAGPVWPPSYSPTSEMRCVVYDMDDDGDVDLADFADFALRQSAEGG